MTVYRITLEKWAGKLTASGNTARWNYDDMFVIYTAGSISLACLELLVHTKNTDAELNYSVTTIEIPDDVIVQNVLKDDLPKGWNKKHHPFCKEKGGKWYSEKSNLVLAVPSSIIESEANYIINTRHPDFNRIKVVNISKFNFDNRLFKK